MPKSKSKIWLSILMLIIILPILSINLVLIIKSAVNPDEAPSVFGIIPLTAADSSMDGDKDGSYPEGALIFIKTLDANEKNKLEMGQVICFRRDGKYITHRIEAISQKGGIISAVTTWGDNEETPDKQITPEEIVGLHVGHISGVGGLFKFISSPVGLAVCFATPIILYIIVDIIVISLKKK